MTKRFSLFYFQILHLFPLFFHLLFLLGPIRTEFGEYCTTGTNLGSGECKNAAAFFALTFEKVLIWPPIFFGKYKLPARYPRFQMAECLPSVCRRVGDPPLEIIGILGPSGIGKSSLLRLITGLEKPKTGEIFYNALSRPLAKIFNLCF